MTGITQRADARLMAFADDITLRLTDTRQYHRGIKFPLLPNLRDILTRQCERWTEVDKCKVWFNTENCESHQSNFPKKIPMRTQHFESACSY